jgi:hypothetical protein
MSMRSLAALWVSLAVPMLCACGQQDVACGADSVTSTLASLVREQYLRVALDTVAYTNDAERKAAFKKATRVTVDETRLLTWDRQIGRLACRARLIIDAPEATDRANAKTVLRLDYGVTTGNDGAFFVEVSFGDLAAIGVPRPGVRRL